jgi:hypothetical protein
MEHMEKNTQCQYGHDLSLFYDICSMKDAFLLALHEPEDTPEVDVCSRNCNHLLTASWTAPSVVVVLAFHGIFQGQVQTA